MATNDSTQMECFTQGMAASGCQPTDIACQCSTGMEKLMKVAVPCLCKSTCTAQDLMRKTHLLAKKQKDTL